MKKTYTSPKLEVVGSIASLTAGESTGNRLDQTFSTGTPFGDLTFS